MIRNRSVPDAQIVPVLAVPDVEAATGWLVRAFGFRCRLRIGRHRAQLTFGGGAVILTHGDPGPGGGGSVHVRVDDADAHHAKAVGAGARILMPPETFEFGERQYTAVDPAGHRWTFSQSVADVDPASWGGELADGG